MFKGLWRTLAFTSNWRARVWRQPSMLLTMIGGPFLILFFFGVGSQFVELPPKTIVVTHQQPGDPYAVTRAQLSTYLDVVEMTGDFNHAIEELQALKVRMVLVMPDNPGGTIQNGKQATWRVYLNEIDPVRYAFEKVDLASQINSVNNQVEARKIDSIKQQLKDVPAQLSQAQVILIAAGVSPQDIARAQQTVEMIETTPTTVLVSPFKFEIQNVTPLEPAVVTFFTPAAIALVIQHLAVMLAALSLVQARLLGVLELWQTAPVRLREIVFGHYASYVVLTGAIAIVLILAVQQALVVPILGPITYFWGSIALLILASLGIGFVISLIASNEQTAAQLAMIVLLGSIFLGGIVQPLEQITFPVRFVSYLLPATYATQILQDIMIRGGYGIPVYYEALIAIAVVGFVLTAALFRRVLKPT